MMIRFPLFIFFVFFSISSFGQDRPKIGLVLSGGGAKGIAHIGALKALEEANIKIDYISGTSMGAIIGGLYASGWNADQVDSIVHHEDLASLMIDLLPRSVTSHFDKEYGEKYAIALTIDEKKINLPSAISGGQMVFNLFSRLTRHVSHVENFEDLPIPFVAYGTNAENGKAVLFEGTDLARVMRASGAFPGLLAPFEIDGKLITDGGIVNNFPAKILKDKGMDIVIGVTVDSELYTKKDLLSINHIIEQVSSFQMVERMRAQRKYSDLIIYPDINEFSVTDFDKADILYQLGYDATKAMWDSLLMYSSDEIIDTKGLVRNHSDTINISQVTILNNEIFSDKKLLSHFKSPLPGKISEKDFYHGINRIFRTHTQQYVDYCFFKNKDQTKGDTLMLLPKTKIGYDKELRLGIHYDDAYKSSVLVNATLLNLITKNSTTSINLILGDKVRYTANFLANFNNIPDIGLDSRLDLNTIPIEISILLPTDSLPQLATFDFGYRDWSNDIYFRFYSDNNHSIGLAGELKYYRTSTNQLRQLNEREFVSENGFYFTGSIFSRFDHLDQKDFAQKGFYSHLQLRYIKPLTSRFYENPIEINSYNLDWSFLKVFPINSFISIGLAGNVGLTSGEATPPYIYTVGGNNKNFINNFKPFEGLGYAQRASNNLITSSLYTQFKALKHHYCKFGVNVAFLSDSIEGFNANDNIRSISAGYGFDSPIGPIEFTAAVSSSSTEFYFNFGHWF